MLREEEEEEEWKKKKKRETAGGYGFTCTSLSSCFTLEVLSLCLLAFFKMKSSSAMYFYRRAVSGFASALAWIMKGMCVMIGGAYNISREWWYALVIFWSSLARHILVPRWTNKRILLFFFAGAAEKNFP